MTKTVRVDDIVYNQIIDICSQYGVSQDIASLIVFRVQSKRGRFNKSRWGMDFKHAIRLKKAEEKLKDRFGKSV